MKRKAQLILSLLVILMVLPVFAKPTLLKKWDVVETYLNTYLKQEISALSDFGKPFEVLEIKKNIYYKFTDETRRSAITFIVSREKIRNYTYEGSYKGVCSILKDTNKLNLCKLQSAAENYIGLKKSNLEAMYTDSSIILQNTQDGFIIGSDRNNFISFLYTGSSSDDEEDEDSYSSRNSKDPKVKTVALQGNYSNLKNILQVLPKEFIKINEESIFSKTENIKKATMADIQTVAEKKRLGTFFTTDKSSAMQYAIQIKNIPVALWLIDNEVCDVNHCNVYGKSAVNDAIDAKNTRLLESLIKHGADLSNENYLFKPILSCIYADNVECAQILKDNDSLADYISKEEDNLIHIAVANSKQNIIPFFVENGSDINKKEIKSGNTPLAIAIKKDDADLIDVLVQNGADVETLTSNKNVKPIFYAVENEKFYAVEALIKNKVDFQSVNTEGKSPFLLAYEKESDDIAKLLIDSGVKFPEDMLLRVISDKRTFYYDPLINAGVNLKTVNSQRENVLHITAKTSDLFALNKFLAKNKEKEFINAKDANGDTPLLIACATGQGFSEGVKELIKAGANIIEKNRRGETPIILAVQNNSDTSSKEMCRAIIEKDFNLIETKRADGSTPLLIALETLKPLTTEFLIDSKANFTVKNASGNTPLHICCDKKYENLLKKLISLGADYNAINNRKETPVTIIVRQKDDKMIDYVLALDGVKIDIIDSNGRTARNYCSQYYQEKIQTAIKNYNTAYDAKISTSKTIDENAAKIKEFEVEKKQLQSERDGYYKMANATTDQYKKNNYNHEAKMRNIKIIGLGTQITALNIAQSTLKGIVRDLDAQMVEYKKTENNYKTNLEKLNNIPRI